MNTTMMSSSNLGIPMAQEALDHSANLVDVSLQADRNFFDLSDLLQVPKHSQPCASGLMDYDYPSLADPNIGLSSVSELGSIKKIPLPAELVEQFGHMQCNCRMGLFSEISRAWLSIDSDIFVWNYEDGTDLAYFDGLSETILSVGLVKPKLGIFQPRIEYLLCLSTPVDIVLLGVSFTKPFEVYSGEPSLGEMHLLPEPLFSIPTDNVHILTINGADNGRIFMGGKDGCLYELIYQAEDGWFSRKCYKVNHSQSKLSFIVPSFLNFSFAEDDPMIQISVDDSRNILYTRSEKSTIQVFDLGEDGKGMGRVAAISLHTTVQNAALVAKTIDRSHFKPIIHLAAIPKSESVNVHLVAITQAGVRLYFTTCPFNNNRGRPYMLSMIHVRMPPGFSASAPPQRPSSVHAANYSKGTLILAAAQSEDNDMLWTITSDTFPFQRHLQETNECLPIDGHTWALAEIPNLLPKLEPDSVVFGGLARADPPLVVTQHMNPERRFVLINSQGSYLFTKQSPVDQLKELLLRFGPDSEDVRSFFHLHKEQACATCLVLACSHAFSDQQVVNSATRAFFLHGGDPEYNFNATTATLGPTAASPMSSGVGCTNPAEPAASPGPGFHPVSVSTPYPNVAQQLQFTSPGNVSMFGCQNQEVIFSNKHKGLCLYLCRILRPIWESSMVQVFPVQKRGEQTFFLASRCNSEELNWILKELTALKLFVDTNSQFASPLLAEGFSLSNAGGQRTGMQARGDFLDDQTRRKYQAEAESQENASMKQIQQLLARSCESLGLWKILCDHQFHIITAALIRDQQNTLQNMSFKVFVTLGREISHALITSLINMYLDDNAATDAISSRLREVCPSLYSTEDEVYSKGNEKLKGAKTSQNPLEREKYLTDSLERYKQIAVSLDLPTVCTQFAQVRFYRGIVDLSLTAAARRDPQGLALHWYRNREPPEDNNGRHAYMERMSCYKCITETMDYLLSTSMSHPHSPCVPKVPGPPPAPDPNRLTNTEAEKYSEEMFSLALKSDDEMFHVALYDWLIEKHLSEKLLTIQSSFLEPYLKRKASIQPDHIPMLDLLWKFYEKTKDYSAASRILARLADKQGVDLSLQQRREYLSRAIMCAKSCTQRTSSGTEGEFLHELEEKMEVTRLQVQIHDALSRIHADPTVQEALATLNSELLDITRLYGDFADRFDLSECKLAIIHCAGHDDVGLVEALWQDIIERELQQGSSNDKRTQMKTLGNKIVSLGRTYGGTDKYCPIAFLLKYLEKRICELNFDSVDLQFVFRTMQEVGVIIPRLHEMYDRLFKSKDPCWKAVRKPYHLLFVIHQLLVVFVEAPAVVPAYEKRHFTTTALDAVANYLIELQAESTADKNVGTLISYFKDIQARMERI